MAKDPTFPAFIRLAYSDDGSAKTQFLAAVDDLTAQASQRFDRAFAEIGNVIGRAKGQLGDGKFRLDFDVSALRQSAADAGFAYEKLRAAREAAVELARSTGDTSLATKSYLDALRAQTVQAEAARSEAQAQAETYTRLQAEIEKTVAANARLAQSYRDTFAEQARTANNAFASQTAINARISPTLSGGDGIGALGSRAVDNGAGYSALAELVEREAAAEKAAAAARIEAARTMEALAAETVQLRAALDPTVTVQRAFDGELERAQRLYQAGAISAAEYASAQRLARENLASGYSAIVGGAKAAEDALRKTTEITNLQRFGFQNLAFQASDVAVQFAAGTPLLRIFAQQGTQVAQAVGQAAGGAKGFAAFLGGPWPILVTAALTALTPFIGKLLETGPASEDAKAGLIDLSGSFSSLSANALTATDALTKFLETLPKASAAADAADKATKSVALASSQSAKLGAQIRQIEAEMNGPIAAAAGEAGAIGQQARLDALKARKAEADKVVKDGRQVLARLQSETQAAAISAKKRDELSGIVQAENKSGGRKRSTGGRSSTVDPLGTLARRSGDEIAAIAAQFDDQPTAVDRSAAAVRKLDEIIRDLSTRKPPNFAKLVEQAEAARAAAKGFVDLDLAKAARQADRALAIEVLRVSGREKEAAIAQAITSAQEREGALSTAQLQTVTDQAAKEFEINRALAERQRVQDLYLSATRSVRAELDNILAGQGKISNIANAFRQLRGQALGERLFGGAFRDLETAIKGRSGVDTAVRALESQTSPASDAARAFADALTAATGRITGAPSAAGTTSFGLGAIGQAGAGASAAAGVILAGTTGLTIPGGVSSAANDNRDPNEIVSTAHLPKPLPADPSRLSPFELANLTGQAVGSNVAAALGTVGIRLSSQATRVLGGTLAGYAYTGTAGGAVLGALREIPKLSSGIDKLFGGSDRLGGAIKGIGTGQDVAGLANAFGIHLSKTGSEIGGAIGSFLPIPGGDIIGSIVGGAIGKLFSKTTKGYAIVNQSGVTAGGNNAALTAQEKATGDSIRATVAQIADQLGATVGNYAVSIAQRSSGYIHVSASGAANVGDGNFVKKAGADAIYNGKDQAAALAAAIQNVIQDGAIKGISAASQRILTAGAGDLSTAVNKALAIEAIPRSLKAITDPVGAAVDDLNRQFAKLIGYLDEGGASAEQYGQAQDLYQRQRAAAIKQASDQVTSSLRGLFDSLTAGNDALSLTDRRGYARAALDPLEARVKAGDSTAYADFANAAQTLLGIERAISGSQVGYQDLAAELRQVSGDGIAREQRLIDAATGTDSRFASTSLGANDNAPVVNAIGNLGDRLEAKLDALIGNQINGIRFAAGGGGPAATVFAPSAATSFF